MTLEEKGSVAAATRRTVLYSTAAVGSFAAASLIAPGIASACHNYPGGCYQKKRDEEAGQMQTSSSSSSSNTSSSSVSEVSASGSDSLPYSGQFYGCHVNGGGIGNLMVKSSSPVAQRFRAEASGSVNKVKVVQKYGSGGYSQGNGGTIEVTLRSKLDGPILGTTGVISSPTSRGKHPIYSFKKSVVLKKGQTYFLQYSNTSSSSYLSINCLHSTSAPKPLSAWPFWANSTTSFRKEKGRWLEKANHFPIFDLYYTNGLVKGNGWYQGVRSDPHRIGGNAGVRQSFVPNRNMRTKAVSVRVYQTRRSPSNMRVSIQDANRRILAYGTLSRYSVTVTSGDKYSQPAFGWNTVTLNTAVTLNAGQRYYVVYDATGGGYYAVIATQNASEYFAFKDDKSVSFGKNGRAEYSYKLSSSYWPGFTHHGKTNRPDCDLGCLLHLV